MLYRPPSSPAPFPAAYAGPKPSSSIGRSSSSPLPAARPRFPISPNHTRQYANLYSIIQTLELMQESYSEGDIDSAKFETSLREIVRQYGLVQQALGLSPTDVDSFCAACGISAQYSLAILRDPTAGLRALYQSSRTSVAPASVFDLAQLFVEILDHSYATTDPLIWAGLIRTVDARLREIGAVPRLPEAAQFVRKWQLFFNAIPAGEAVPEDKRFEIRAEATQLSERLKAWLASKK